MPAVLVPGSTGEGAHGPATLVPSCPRAGCTGARRAGAGCTGAGRPGAGCTGARLHARRLHWRPAALVWDVHEPATQRYPATLAAGC
eukprot:15468030-Alexandrium_andersonii.AAC.1